NAREPERRYARGRRRPGANHAGVGSRAPGSDARLLSRADAARHRVVRGERRVGGTRRRLRDPGPRCGPRRADRGRLPQRRRAAVGAARSPPRGALPGDVRVRMSESAVRAAVEVAAEHELRSDDPVVLRDAWHVLVHLRPLPLVARVSSGRPYPEGPHEHDVIRELAVASHAARAGAPVVPPSGLLDPGPHRHGGHVVAFWQYVEPKREVEPVAAGEGLREIHEALFDYGGELPSLHTDDLARITDSLELSVDVEFLRKLGLRQPAGRS